VNFTVTTTPGENNTLDEDSIEWSVYPSTSAIITPDASNPLNATLTIDPEDGLINYNVVFSASGNLGEIGRKSIASTVSMGCGYEFDTETGICWFRIYDSISGVLLIETPYLNNVIHGTKTIFQLDGVTPSIETPYIDGVINGTKNTYHPDGHIASITPYTDGVINGTKNTYHPDGHIASITPYTDGVINGTKMTYSSDGVIYHETPYTDGVINGTVKYYRPDGSIWIESIYVNGLREGNSIEYFPEGSIAIITPFINNLIEGNRLGYLPGGIHLYTTPFSNNLREGIHQSFNRNGSVWYEIYFLHDIAIWRKNYDGEGNVISEEIF
jgi:antitoxin component YwqK of YwqJK toxin-antitoxin module